jgi:hypothetical protein
MYLIQIGFMLRYAYIHNCGCYHVFHLNACCCRYWTPFIVYLVKLSEYVENTPLKHWACSFLQHCLTYLVLSSFAVLTLRMPAVVVCMPSVLVYALTRNRLTWVIIPMLRRPHGVFLRSLIAGAFTAFLMQIMPLPFEAARIWLHVQSPDMSLQSDAMLILNDKTVLPFI